MRPPPNIILCTCDQLRAHEVGCYGNSAIRTPNIDRLAAEGMRFETGVTNYPLCLPARSILLSGQYNRTCTGGSSNVTVAGPGGRGFFPQYPEHGRPHLKDPTLAEALRGAGYETAAIGKWHIHSWPDDVGFDSYLIPRVNHCHTGQSFTENGGVEFVPAGYSVDYEADRLEQFLGPRDGTRPFFMYYNISPPHCPFADAPRKYLEMYDPEAMPIRANVDLKTPLANQEQSFKVYRWDFRYYNHRLPATMRLPEGYTLRHLIAEYYGLTTWVDDTVGRLLEVLDRTGLSENTIVVFTSDHGDNLGSHGLVQKGGPNEESIRIPLIVRLPAADRRPGVDRTHVASLVDLAPTLLALIGADIPRHFQGRDLAPRCRGQDSDVPAGAFVETGEGVAIRTLEHLYYLPFAGDRRQLAGTPAQCFDLRDDPYQQRNLARAVPAPGAARELDERLRQWHAETPWMAAE
jgi:arylsulfatase A-like enzyme